MVLDVVVDDADLRGTGVRPAEDDAPLVVDPNGVESMQVAPQGLQSIARRGSKVLEVGGGSQHVELAKGGSSQIGWKPLGESA
jgi:hypothetical protein